MKTHVAHPDLETQPLADTQARDSNTASRPRWPMMDIAE